MSNDDKILVIPLAGATANMRAWAYYGNPYSLRRMTPQERNQNPPQPPLYLESFDPDVVTLPYFYEQVTSGNILSEREVAEAVVQTGSKKCLVIAGSWDLMTLRTDWKGKDVVERSLTLGVESELNKLGWFPNGGKLVFTASIIPSGEWENPRTDRSKRTRRGKAPIRPSAMRPDKLLNPHDPQAWLDAGGDPRVLPFFDKAGDAHFNVVYAAYCLRNPNIPNGAYVAMHGRLYEVSGLRKHVHDRNADIFLGFEGDVVHEMPIEELRALMPSGKRRFAGRMEEHPQRVGTGKRPPPQKGR